MTGRSISLLASLAAVLTAAPILIAQSHVMQNVSDAGWGVAPPMVPAGAQIAVLSGNPMAATPYAVRLKFPANYTIPAHSHPTDENVVVVTGQLFMGMGDKLDKTHAHSLTVGGYALMPANANHFAYTTSETTIVLYGVGPVEFKYVNPKDDPRKTATQQQTRRY